MKIVKARSSRHSERAHRYHIVRGLGLIVEPGEFTRSASTRFPAQLRQLLRGTDVPKAVADRVEKLLEGLTDDDFKNLKPEQVLDLIRHEYGTG